MRKLIKKYNIKTVRYFGEHQRLLYGKKMRLKLFILKLFQVKGRYAAKSCNIDFYLTKKDLFTDDKCVELYVHPDYVDGKLIDNSISSFGNEMRLLEENYSLIKNEGNLISWREIK